MKNVIQLGDATSHSGKVVAASATAFVKAAGAGCAQPWLGGRGGVGSPLKVAGAFLVVSSDVDTPCYPVEAIGFQPMPMERLPFPSIVMASSNDQYVTLERARAIAAAWAAGSSRLGKRDTSTGTVDTARGPKGKRCWRKYFAVKPEWNQNGWHVEYEILAGETLSIWRGPASSQNLDGTNYYLEGGREQIVFVPDVRDEMVDALPRIDRETGLPIKNSGGEDDRRVEFVDITGQVTPAKVCKQIKHARIKGPFDTGWGATDYTAQEAKRILLTVPTSP